ncbi:MAG: tetratricopeptide repeat protein, partial [Cyclobacteriaceae bacterium]
NCCDQAEYFVKRAVIRLPEDRNAAIADLEEAISRDSQLADARYLKAQIHFDDRDWSSAIPELEYLKSQQFKPRETLFMLGISQLEEGDAVNARLNLQAAREAGSQEYRLLAALGEFAYEDEDWEGAVSLLTLALQQNPNSELETLRALSNFELQNYKDVIADLKDKNLDSFHAASALGRSYYETDDHSNAVTALSKALDLKPEGEIAYLLGNSQFLLKKYVEAAGSYLKAVENKYETAVLYNNLGKAYEQSGSIEDAISAYTKAIDIEPGYQRAMQNRGIAYFDHGNYEGAIGDLSEIDDENNEEVNFYLAESYFKTEAYKPALSHYNKAIAAGRKDGHVYHRRGRTYIELDQAAAALADLDLAIQAGKKDASVYMDRAQVNIYMNNERAAMADLNEAITRDGNNADAYYNRGYLKELQENFNEAIIDYKKVIELNPEDDKAFYALANCTVSAGNVGGGLTFIEKAISINDQEASYYKVKGNILYRIAREEEACEFWEKAISMGDRKASFYINQYCK